MFAAGILVPTLALVVVLLWQFSVREQRLLEGQAHDATVAIIADIDRDFAAQTAVLQTLAASMALRAQDFAAFRRTAEEGARALGVDVVARDLTGQRLFDTGSGLARVSSGGGPDDVERRALAGRGPAFSGVYAGEDGTPIVSVYVPVLQDGAAVLLLGLEKPAARVRELTLQAGLPDGWRTGVIDASWNIIARITQQDEYVGKPTSAEFSAHATGDSGVWRGRNQEGLEIVSAYARSRLSGWYVAVGIPAHLLEAPLRSALGALVTVATVGAILALALAWLVGRRIAAPIRALVATADDLGRGEAVAPVLTPLREANELGDAFRAAGDLARQRTAALDKSLRRTTEVLESIGDGFFAIDADWRFTYINHRALQLLGMTTKQVLGRPLLELSAHLGDNRIEANFRQAIADDEPREFETMSPISDRWLSVSVYPQAGGGLSVYFRDVTEQRVAATELSASEERLRLAQEAAGIGTWEMRPGSGYFVWSMSLYNLVGLDPATTPPSFDAYLRIVHPDDRPLVLGLQKSVSRATGPINAEYRIVRGTDGVVRWLASHSVLHRAADGETSRVFGVVTDVTERRTVIEALTRVQDLQSQLIHVGRLTDMGQMAATLAHELNQPLAGILNYVQASRRMIERGTSTGAQVDAALQKAAEQTQRAGEIIRRLRAFVETGELRRQAEQILGVIEDATALALVGVSQPALRPRITIEQGLPDVLIDKVQIQQVLVNLIRNAVDAMQLTGRYELVIAALAADNDKIEVNVSDSGPGLSPEVMTRLFQPFTTTKSGGMGVGLSICRTIVQAHGGLIWTQPNLGGGTTFFFTIPTVGRAVSAPPA